VDVHVHPSRRDRLAGRVEDLNTVVYETDTIMQACDSAIADDNVGASGIAGASVEEGTAGDEEIERHEIGGAWTEKLPRSSWRAAGGLVERLSVMYPNAAPSPTSMRVALVLALLFPLAACQPSTSVGPNADSFFALKDSSITHASRSALATGDTARWKDIGQTRFLEGVVPAMRATHEAVGSTSSWREKDVAVRRFIEVAHPDPSIQSWRERIAASSILPGHLVNTDELTPEKQEAIAYYVTLVIENRDFQGTPRLGPALDRLEGYWPAAKLAEARQLVDAATLHAERVSHP